MLESYDKMLYRLVNKYSPLGQSFELSEFELGTGYGCGVSYIEITYRIKLITFAAQRTYYYIYIINM